LGAVYATMKTVFPQVYVFAARESMNVVLIGVKAGPPLDSNQLPATSRPADPERAHHPATFRARVQSLSAARTASVTARS